MNNRKRIDYRVGLAGVVLLVATLACTLSSGDNTKQQSVPPSPVPLNGLPTPNPFGFATPTPFPTVTPSPIPSTPTPIPCMPYVAWPVYTVQDGDTLFQIALATGTSVEQLVIANCLLDANMIGAGDPLHVPRLPIPPTPAPTLTPVATVDVLAPRFTASLTADKHWISTRTGQPTTYHPTVRVDLGEVYNAERVDFYVNDTAGGTAISIGSDTDPWDGAFVDYDFPAEGTYTFTAFAVNPHRTIESNAFTVVYDRYFTPPEGRYDVLVIEPHTYFDGIMYRLQAGTWVTIWWQNAPIGALQIDFYTLPYAASQTQQPRLIGSDRDLLNGASISWQVPGDLNGSLFARATMPDGSLIESQTMTVVRQD